MSFSSTVLADSPIRGYRLDDATKTSGSSVVDSGSQAQNGTVSGTGLTAASSLLTSDSDGATTVASGSYITLPTTGLPTGAAAWSAEAWVNMPSLPGGFATVFHFGTASGNLQSIQLFYRAANTRFEVWGWNTFIVASTGFTPAVGVTYQLVVTYDGSSVVTLYVNGVSNNSASGITMALIEATAQIGNDSTGDFYSGIVDEVWMFSSTLSSTRVAAHYAAGTSVSLSATIPGVGTIAGTLSLKTALAATIAGVGTLSATLSLSGVALSGTLAGTGILAGTLTLKTALAATLPGSGVLAATFSLSTALSATIPGVGTLAGTLSVPTTSLTLYGSGVADGMLTTADQCATTTGGTETSNSTLAPASGANLYLELYSQGKTGTAGPTYSSLPAPTGHGWVWDVTTLEGNTIPAGSWSAAVTMSDPAAAGTWISPAFVLRCYVYNGGVYTAIGSITLASHSIPKTKTLHSFPSTSFASQAFNTGDKLYGDLFIESGSSTNAWSSDTLTVFVSNSASVGVANDFVVTTPGYAPTAVAFSATIAGVGTIAGTLSLKTALAATIAGVGTVTATLSLSGVALSATMAGVGTLAATLTVSVAYTDYKNTMLPNLVAALSAANLLNNVQVLGTDTTSASDTTWLLPASIDLASSLDGYVRHAFPPNATDISNDSREVAVKSLISTIYTNDPTSKPIIQGEMGFGYAGPGQSVTLYQYGVDMADYAVQLARAGMAALLAYDLDDDMHGTQWGFWQITTDTGVPRPWFFPWSLLCNTLVIGSTLYAPAQPASNDFRMLAATSPQGFWTIVLINRKAIAQNVQVIVPFAPVVTTTMQIFTYSQATPLLVDTNGFPLASGSLSVVLQRGFTTSIAANSVLVLTQNAPASTAPPPVGAGLPPQPPIGATTINTYDVKRPPLEKRR